MSEDYKLDVEKTSSIVSPLLGTCSRNVLYKVTDARYEVLWAVNLTLTYGYQGDEWVLTGGQGRVEGGSVGRDETSVLETVVEQMTGAKLQFGTVDELASRLHRMFEEE